MAPAHRRGAHEKESIQRRADGRDAARGRPDVGRRGGTKAQGDRADDLQLAPEPADIQRLRELEGENAKLKRMLAERELAIDTLKEINRRKW